MTEQTATPTNTPTVVNTYVTRRARHADRVRLGCVGNEDGSVTVQAEDHGHADPNRSYRVTFSPGPRGLIWFACQCRAGQFRPGPVPCKHAGAAGRFLESGGLFRFTEQGWTLTGFAAAVAGTVIDAHRP